ncbi:MAG TPA: AAA family ATPase, partial [Nitrososphaera sp.]|nr:AAA family ATPase [Nitrososphaera sp.]
NLLARVAEVRVLHLKDRREPIGNEEAERILRLKTQRGGTEKLHDIQEPVETLLGVQIDAFESETEVPFPRRRGASSAELDVDNFLVAVNGSGIKEALRVILDVEFEKPQILLVEEPEIHLHPALETSMMRYLKKLSSDCQVFITTHSTNFLDTAEMKNVYLVSKPDSTQVQHINLEEAEAQVPKELGLRLSSLFMFDCLVFVEGESDESILREWASKLKVNFSQHNVGFVIMEGVHNFTHYAQERTLSLLTKRQVKMLFLMDRDEREDAEITRLQERCGDKAILVVLKRREIENYLICPRAIAEFIKFKREASASKVADVLPTEFDIKTSIEQCAEELKQLAIDKRVAKILSKPFYPSRTRLFEEQGSSIVERVNNEVTRIIEQLESVKNRVADVQREQTEAVNNGWQTNKSTVVPGDLLLDKVCQKYGVRFKKEQDGAHLAALMTENEIELEIKQIIRKIVD